MSAPYIYMEIINKMLDGVSSESFIVILRNFLTRLESILSGLRLAKEERNTGKREEISYIQPLLAM